MVNGKSRKHGTIYVFETLIGFVTKVFGRKQHDTFHFSSVSEVLRETFHLKKEEGVIEVQLKAHRLAVSRK